MKAALLTIGMLLLGLLAAPVAAQADAAPSFLSRDDVRDQFTRYDGWYARIHWDFAERLRATSESFLRLEAAGKPLPCTKQIVNEARWVLNSTADWVRLERLLRLAAASMNDHDQSFAIEQFAPDGSWGTCYTEWFKKLDPMIDRLNRLKEVSLPPAHPLRFFDRLASPEQMEAYLDGLLVSDIAVTARNNRDELGAVVTVLAQMAFKKSLAAYIAEHVEGVPTDDSYFEAFRRFLERWQDPETGFWGPWFEIEGQLHKAPDLSFTYHIVSYRRGEVARPLQIFDTLMAIRDAEYPFGWRHVGGDHNHNLYDVARIIQYLWPKLDEPRREQARAALQAAMDWSVAETLDEDGWFKYVPTFDSSIGDAFYYGVSFLTTVGYCRPEETTFWGGTRPADAHARCCRLALRLGTLDPAVPTQAAARSRMEASFPDCPVPVYRPAVVTDAFADDPRCVVPAADGHDADIASDAALFLNDPPLAAR